MGPLTKDLASLLRPLRLAECRAGPGSEFHAVTALCGNDFLTISSRGCLGALVCKKVPSSVALVVRWEISDRRENRSQMARGPSVSWRARNTRTQSRTNTVSSKLSHPRLLRDSVTRSCLRPPVTTLTAKFITLSTRLRWRFVAGAQAGRQ